ncbi:hypothetical protein ES705_35772 [subsurface metagenome]|nr:MAG: hypothetical protein ES695_00030 [Candidatus Atribacteria bacterium 1244-E10-H5-B2]
MNRQSKVRCQSSGEINLVREIDDRTKELLKGLSAIESIIIDVNKSLLPLIDAPDAPFEDEDEQKSKSEPPLGWFERHLADLDIIICRATNIHNEVNILNGVIKTDKVG